MSKRIIVGLVLFGLGFILLYFADDILDRLES